jgi:hypothetical protein
MAESEQAQKERQKQQLALLSGIKRPQKRSIGKTKLPAPPEGGIKRKRSKGSQEEKDEASLESTATPEGRVMAQALTMLSPSELSRFEAFRRSAFKADVVSKLVAHCLMEHEERRFLTREGFGAEGPSRPPYRQRDTRPLEDLVAPHASQEITAVVSTLAKCHAQRLVTAARRISEQRRGEHNTVPLTPEELREAHDQLVRSGRGFFLQPRRPANQYSHSSETKERRDLQLNAALAAQARYDQSHGITDTIDDTDKDGDEAKKITEMAYAVEIED